VSALPDILRLIALDNRDFKKALKRQTELFQRELKGYRVETEFIAPYEELYELMITKRGVFLGE